MNAIKATCTIYTHSHLSLFYAVKSRLQADPELKKKLLSVAATLLEGMN